MASDSSKKPLINRQSPLPEEQTAQAKLRAAVFNGVSESDVKDVIAAIVKRSKEGDPQALKYFFEYILGGSAQVVNLTQHNHHYVGDMPVDAAPGSLEKIEAMRRRAEKGLPLTSPNDVERPAVLRNSDSRIA